MLMWNKYPIFNIASDTEFEKIALQIFRFQAENNAIYKRFIKYLNINPANVKSIENIPFLPIQFFKEYQVVSANKPFDNIFKSSGTSGMTRSKHFVKDIRLYEESFLRGFAHFYGNIKEYTILALLPSYVEQGNSSLVYMVEKLIKESGKEASGFYLNNHQELSKTLQALEQKKEKILLIGVSYALLDLVEAHKFNLSHTIIMETGGMKGRRKEMLREELHQILCNGFGVSTIHSEYGMTELLSQSYSNGNGVFYSPAWQKILIRDTEDPFTYLHDGKTGGINIIDLANIYSCSFIATQDLGKKHKNSFEILGRFDNSDIRGCNLLILK